MSSSRIPPWPSTPPRHGAVELRPVGHGDVEMARELSTDSYVPLVGSLSAHASDADVLAWVARQQSRHEEGIGFSFAVVDLQSDASVGHCGLWLAELEHGRATAGYAVVESARGHGYATDALIALTQFGWTLPGLFRIALYIEPWNIASLRTAERAGYAREGLLLNHQEIGGQRRDMLLYASIRPDA